MRSPTMWYVRPSNVQTSLRIRIFYEWKATDWKSFGVSKLKGGYTGLSETTLVKISHGRKSHVVAQI